jgi:hypothetical protein
VLFNYSFDIQDEQQRYWCVRYEQINKVLQESVLNVYLVTTSFSQEATFYAGETVSCTISFTHSLQPQTTDANNGILVKSINQSRTRSFSSLDKIIHDLRRKSLINNKSFECEVESLALAEMASSRKMSLSSFASSTFSYFTGSTALRGKESTTNLLSSDAKGMSNHNKKETLLSVHNT